MTRSPLLALPVLLAGAPTAALTPEELWSAWQAQAAGFGATLAAEAARGADGSLTLRELTLAVPGRPPEPLPPESPVREVTLTPAADGAVAIGLGLPEDGVVASGDLRFEQDGLAITARDGTGGVEYEVAARSLRWAFLPPPDSVGASDFAVEVAGLAARFPGQIGADRSVAVTVSAEGYAYVANAGDPSGLGSSQAARLEGPITLAATVTVPEGLSLDELTAPGPEVGPEAGLAFLRALDGGLAARIDVSTGPLAQTTQVEGFPFAYRAEVTSAPGAYSVALDGSAFALLLEYGGGTVMATSPELPFSRLDLSFGRVGAEVRVPLGPAVGDFRYMFALEDVVLGEEAWAAFDPQGLLPRGPARVVIDLGGRAALDLAAGLAAEAAGAVPPVPTIETLEVRAFEVAGAGLQATATGSFTFDNASGAPVPAGEATARVEGLDRLLDALVGLGAVTAADARSARLGIAAFFRAGDGPDVRETAIEARPDGTVLVNGRQVQ